MKFLNCSCHPTDICHCHWHGQTQSGVKNTHRTFYGLHAYKPIKKYIGRLKKNSTLTGSPKESFQRAHVCSEGDLRCPQRDAITVNWLPSSASQYTTWQLSALFIHYPINTRRFHQTSTTRPWQSEIQHKL